MIIGADVGGTFTDLVMVRDGSITTHKTPTTPNQSIGVADGVDALREGATASALIHGTTVATNALLERSGAETALVTDEGFEDVIEIARQDRPSLYDSFDDRSIPLVSRASRIGVAGDVVDAPLADQTAAVAIATIDAHVDPERERRLAESVAAQQPDAAISLSSEVAPEFREFERTSTTVLNAYLSPVTREYLDGLDAVILSNGRAQSLSVMRSSGGLMSVSDAASLPAAVLLSGPAGGVVAAGALANRLGLSQVISFDMGGTSTDVCRIEEYGADLAYERAIDGYVCRMPSVGIHTVGAGGGSIAWVDPGGALRVGPRSAGAHPGPVAYGRGGTDATVTDANVVLGRIDASARLGGSVTLDVDAARAAVRRLGEKIGLSETDAALGILAVAEDVMSGAVRTVTVEQGFDPSEAHLVAFGGAGGLHASAVARSLGMAGVVVPEHAGVFSALGLLLAPPRSDAVAAVYIVGADLSQAADVAERLEQRTRQALTDAGHSVTDVVYTLDVRYLGQSHELGVPWQLSEEMDAVASRFEALHRRRRGFVQSGDPIEVVAVRCAAIGEPAVADTRRGRREGTGQTPRHRPVVTNGGDTVQARVIERARLLPGTSLDGPAVVEEADATTYIDGDETVEMRDDGSLVVTW